jgi:hypothetical protein
MFLGLSDPDPLVRGMDPDPAPDPDPSVFQNRLAPIFVPRCPRENFKPDLETHVTTS